MKNYNYNGIPFSIDINVTIPRKRYKLTAKTLKKEYPAYVEYFIIRTLREFYEHLREHGLEEPLEVDKYRNPNPLKIFKVYSNNETLLIHFMINEQLLNVKILMKGPLMVEGSISQKGLDYLFLNNLLHC